MSKRGRRLVGRNAGNGRFTTVARARKHKGTHVVERMPKGRKKK